MPIRFACPVCKATLKASDDKVGVDLPCPKCKRKVQVPFADESLPADQEWLTVVESGETSTVTSDSSGKLSPFAIAGLVGVIAWIFYLTISAALVNRREADERAKYPEPTTKYQGRTAVEWGERAMDADFRVSSTAADALLELGAEGVPFLLRAAEQQTNPNNGDFCYNRLVFLKRFINPADMPRLEKLQEKYAH